MVLFLAVTARQQTVAQKIKNFFTKWREVQQKIPLPEMTELLITPQLPEYPKIAEEVFMLLSLMDDPQRIAVQGKVVWVTPEGVQGNRTQGIGVQFTHDETGAAARATIERILGETMASNRPTHTM